MPFVLRRDYVLLISILLHVLLFQHARMAMWTAGYLGTFEMIEMLFGKYGSCHRNLSDSVVRLGGLMFRLLFACLMDFLTKHARRRLLLGDWLNVEFLPAQTKGPGSWHFWWRSGRKLKLQETQRRWVATTCSSRYAGVLTTLVVKKKPCGASLHAYFDDTVRKFTHGSHSMAVVHPWRTQPCLGKNKWLKCSPKFATRAFTN